MTVFVYREPFLDPTVVDVILERSLALEVYRHVILPNGKSRDRMVLGFDNGYAASIIPEMTPNFLWLNGGDAAPMYLWEVGWLAFAPDQGWLLMPQSEPQRRLTVLDVIGICRMIRKLPQREESMADLWDASAHPMFDHGPNPYRDESEIANHGNQENRQG